MASPLANIIAGATVAVIIVGMLIVPTINGIETWKFVLGAIGLWLISRARRSDSR